MKYVSLLKKFYMSNDNGVKDYNELINSPSTLKFNIKYDDYPFFVNVNNEILRLTEKIYALNGKILKNTYGNKRLPPIILKWIVNRTLVEEVRISNEIEGVVSTRKEINELMSKKNPNKYKRLYGMVNKYKQLTRDNEKLVINSSTDIRNLYSQTMLMDVEKDNPKNVPDGKIFRKELVSVVASEREIHRGLYPEKKVIDTMEEALKILNDESISLLVRVAVFHYFFVYIHPFYDGNGRMSRFISSIYLNKELDILCSLQLSVSCKHHQKQYYESFKIANDKRNKGDLTHFVISFLEILEYGLETLKNSIEEKIIQFFHYSNVIGEKIAVTNKNVHNLLYVLLQNKLFGVDDLKLNDLVKILEISKSSVNKLLLDEQVQKFVVVNKSEKSFRYSLNLDVFDNL